MVTDDEARGKLMKKWLTFIVFVGVITYVGTEVFYTFKESKQREPIRSMQATDFSLTTLDGRNQTLHEEQGKIVILNFWASWCEPCKIEMPHFQTIYEQYEQDLEILAVNYTTKDKLKDVKNFVQNHALTFPILLDETGDISTMYGAFALPTTIILDRTGTIAHEIIGPLDEAALETLIKKLL